MKRGTCTVNPVKGAVKYQKKSRRYASNNSWKLNWNNGNMNNNNRNNNNYIRAFRELFVTLSLFEDNLIVIW